MLIDHKVNKMEIEDDNKSKVADLKAVMLICVACGNGSFDFIIESSKQGGIDYA